MRHLLLVTVTCIISGLAFGVTGSIRPAANSFVLDPGIASPFPTAADRNFGGSGSLCVSSATARAYDPNAGIDHDPKGEFVTLLRFDPNVLNSTTVSKLNLRLAITNGNRSAKGVFNYVGSPGDFDIHWIVNDWQQGWGTSKVVAGPDAGITYNTLNDLLGVSTYFYLETLYYDAEYPYSAGENWFEFDLDLANPNYADLIDAIENGEQISLMLSAPQYSDVCFNLRAYKQYLQDGTYTVRSTGPYLEVVATLPFDKLDFNASGKVDSADLQYITANWLQTGDNLTADIAPAGGDGIVNYLDLAEFAKYWQVLGP